MKFQAKTLWLPTSVLFLDDEAPFLASLPYAITEAFPCLRHTSPRQAMTVLNQSAVMVDERVSEGVDLDIWFGNCSRFEMVSVVVVDFEMPTMRGLEFCRQIAQLPDVHFPSKRIMLTGTMDKGAAVEAFNEGLIHRYLRKDDPNSMPKLQRYISELQQEYLADLTQKFTLRPNFQARQGSLDWCQDRALMETVHVLVREQGFVEFVCVPGGVVLADRAGSTSMLLIRNSDEMDAQAQRFARVSQLSSESQEQLQRREKIYFDPDMNHLIPVGANGQGLEDKLVPARSILGTLDNYSVALLESYSPVGVEACGLDDFLEHLESPSL